MMRRFHVHLGVPDLAASVRFYSNLFGMPPAVERPDYAKWMLDDPRVNFAISHRSERVGLNHLGLQVESADDLADVRRSFASADASSVSDEPNAHCCYALGNKHWTRDPQGIPWEAFHTLDSIPVFDDAEEQPVEGACGAAKAQCCAPAAAEPAVAAPTKRSACCA